MTSIVTLSSTNDILIEFQIELKLSLLCLDSLALSKS